MKKWIVGIVLAGAAAAASVPAFGDSTGAVAARVQVASPCLIVTPSSVDFGTITFPFQANGIGPEQPFAINICGITQTILARGTDATSSPAGVSWQLGPAGGSCQRNVYGENVRVQAPIAGGAILTTTDQVVLQEARSNVAGTLQVLAPCAGSDGAGQVMTFSYVFTATM
jgi:hypothetical protein